MNNIFFALCFLFILTCFSHAQNKTIYLKDSESKEPIAYATIVGSGDFIYSDFDGSFEINRVDSLIISHVNYGVQVILFESHTNDSIIYLKQIVNVLEEVIVSKTNKKQKTSTLGKIAKRSNFTINIAEKMQMVVFFPESYYNVGSKIISIQIPLYSRKNEVYNTLLIRPKIYTVDSISLLASTDLLKQNEIVKIEFDNSKFYSINLEENNLNLPKNGVFIGFELIGAIVGQGNLV